MTFSHSSNPSQLFPETQSSHTSNASYPQELSDVLAQRPLGLVFDIDGTLSPIASTPDAAYLYPGVKALLERIRDLSPAIHVAIMTGRGIQDGARLVNVEGLTYIGTHGLEWSDGLPTTHAVRIVPEATAYVEPGKAVLKLVEQHIAEFPSVIVQYKNVGGTLHYRATTDPEGMRKRLLAFLEKPIVDAGMRLAEGKMVVEVLAPLSIDKGQGLQRYVQQHDLRGVLFAGDDRTDYNATREAIRMRQEQPERYKTFTIAVQHHDTPPMLLEHSDLTVQGVEGAVQLIQHIVEVLEHSINSSSR